MELREYQTKLISDIRQAISDGHRRIIVQLFVGGGKTVIASEIIRGAKEKLNRSLFLAPRRQLVYQTVETLNRFDINAGLIMAGENPFTLPLAQVGSFDTITSRVRSGRMQIPSASLVLADECHATFSCSRLELLAHYPIVLGLTSTPTLANGKGMGAFYTKIVQGPTMKQLVEWGFLVPMRYFGADAPDLEKCKIDKDGDYQEKALADATDKPELIGAIYDNYKRIVGDRTTLIFAVNCKHARHIHDEFKSHGVNVEYIDGSTPTEERDEIRKRVESGQTKVIVNIGVMAFGTDWPIISCIIIARVTRNIAAWIQMIGRGSRLHPGKLDTIVIYHGNNFDELGPIDDDIEWSLDDKTTVRERKEKALKDAKEPKEITCKCGRIFRGSRICPSCGLQVIPKGEAIPYHEADLKELVAVKKPAPAEKADWYAQILHISRSKGYQDGWAANKFRDKFGEWPNKKKGVIPIPPTQDVLNFMQHLNIKRAKAAA
jgi:superfamily II DNA or RNA helicase